MEGLFWLAVGISFIWLLYMATFRTRDLLDLQKAQDERVARVGRAAGKAGFGLLRWWMRRR